ncbi:sodium:solute symporter family protein [Candidatus Latescibacterota bacterium]
MGYGDIVIIVLYFVVVISLGFWYQKRASKNLESYFLGGKSLHWLALAMSGSVSTFDITGTMWIVSLLFVLGMKSMWIHWMWGVMMGAFFMAYMGKWVRRSRVITAAEWMVTRFGSDRGGRTARTAYALMAIITLTSFIGYAFQGIGKFAAIYIPFEPHTCATIIIGVTTIYVILGGLYSVVITQVIQTFILTFASILIAAVAYVKLNPVIIAEKIPPGWTSLVPQWHLADLAGTEHAGYELFGALVIVWVIKGFLLNAGGPAQMYDFQLLLATRNPRDASKVGAAWSFFLIVRWGMAAGITLLALSGTAHVSDPEQVMPMVLKEFLPAGIRGIVIAGLLAAFMSTFSATINSAASFVVRDLVQPLLKRQASQKHLIVYSRISTVAVVIIGIAVGYQAQSIAQIWNWIMMALGAGVIIPNVLRWYWWRVTGWGYAAGTLGGIALSLGALFYPDAPMYVIFPPICIGSLIACVAGSLLTSPVDERILVSFYTSVKPFGLWQPIRERAGLPQSEHFHKSEKASLTLLNTGLGMIAVTGYYLFPMYLTGHWHGYAVMCLLPALLATAILTVTWYRNLPAAEE